MGELVVYFQAVGGALVRSRTLNKSEVPVFLKKADAYLEKVL